MERTLDEKYKIIKNRLTDLCLLAIGISYLPTLITFITRIRITGIKVQSVVFPIIFTVLLITYVFRKHIKLWVKVTTLISIVYIVGILGYLSYGLMSSGQAVLVMMLAITTLLTKRRIVFVMYFLTMVAMISIAYLYTNQTLIIDFNLEQYIYDTSTWSSHVSGFISISLILVLSIYYMMKQLNVTLADEVHIKEQHETLIEGIEDDMFSIDQDGKFIAINKSFEEKLERKREEIISKPYTEVFRTRLFPTEKHSNLVTEKLEYVFKEMQPVNFHFEVPLDGIDRIFDVRLLPVFSDGEIIQIIGNSRDITDLIVSQKKIEEMLATENERLEHLIEERTQELETTMKELMNKERLASLGSLVAGVSHEVNTPLGVAVTATTFLIKKNNDAYEKLKDNKFGKNDLVNYMKMSDETAEIIYTNISRAAELVKSFKQISVNQSVLMLTTFNLIEFVHSIIVTLKHEYKNQDYTFELDIPDDLVIKSYPSAYSQIITNLIMNSLRHGFKGREHGIIKIAMLVINDQLEIRYCDDGRGIDEESQKRIFDPFYTTDRSNGGSGLGMSIIYNIVNDQLKGSISVSSEVEKGSEFKIIVPLETKGGSDE